MHGWSGARTGGGADGQSRTANSEVGHRERKHEEHRAIFALLRKSCDHKGVEHDIQDDQDTDNSSLRVAGFITRHDEVFML